MWEERKKIEFNEWMKNPVGGEWPVKVNFEQSSFESDFIMCLN